MCIEVFVVISDGSLHLFGIRGDIPFIVIYCIYLILLSSFLLIWLAVYFVDLFKKTAPGFIDFFEGFLCLIFFRSALILVIFCLLLAFE